MTGWDRYDMPGWSGPLRDAPVMVDNDANARAFGEAQTGVAT